MQHGNSGVGMTRSTARKICGEIAKPGYSARKPQAGGFFLFGSKADMSKVEVVVKRSRALKK